MLKRSALAVARFESGWNASPASFTSDLVSFEVSATARSNDARANSPCSCRYSVGDFASASERIASAACSTPSRLDGDHVLADRASALGGDAAGLDDRFDVGAGEVGELFGDLLAALDEILAALVGVGEQRLERRERRNGVEAVEEIVVGHGLNPFLGRAGSLARGGLARGGAVLRRCARCERRAVFCGAASRFARRAVAARVALRDLGALLDDLLGRVGDRLGDLGRSLGSGLQPEPWFRLPS